MPTIWRCCAVISFLAYAVWSQDSVLLAFSKNPIYNEETVMLTCYFASHMSLRIFTLEAFNGTRRAGSLSCAITKNATSDGVLKEMTVDGCLTAMPGYVRVIFRASPSLDLDYKCSVRVSDDFNFYNWTSCLAHLTLKALPEIPRLAPYKLMFNESDRASVVCQSRNGKPPALLSLTVSTRESVLKMAVGNETVSLQFSSPLNLRNATASCSVLNHNVANMTTRSSIIIIYISTLYEKPLEVFTGLSDVTNDCSAAIECFPAAAYRWKVPAEANFSESALNTSILTIPKGLAGLFNCTATNVVSLRSVVITYQASNENNVVSNWETEGRHIFSITVFTFGGIAIMTALVVILIYKQKIKLKFEPWCVAVDHLRNETPGRSTPIQQPKTNSSTKDDNISMTENLIYEGLPSQPTDDNGTYENYRLPLKPNN